MERLNYFIKRLRRRVRQTNLLNYAAQLSYGLMLAFLPLLMLLSLVLNLVFENKMILQETLSFISIYLPTQIETLIRTSLETNESHLVIQPSSSTAINIALLIFIVYSVIRLFHSAMVIFTKISDMQETRNFIFIWILAVIDLISLLVLIAIATYLYIELRLLLFNLFSSFLSNSALQVFTVFLKRFIYVYIFILLGFVVDWALATFPCKKIRYRDAIPGTIFVLIGWLVSLFFTNGLSRLFDVEGFVSILDQGIILMITIYLLSLVLLIGVLINHEIQTVKKKLR